MKNSSNWENISRISIFAVRDLPRNTAKIGRRENFPFYGMLRQNSKRFYKGLYVTFKLKPNLKKNTVNLSSYCPSNEGHVSILKNAMIRTYTSDTDERIILRYIGEMS